MRDMPRILLIKTSSLGDVVHNLPVVGDILAHLPQANIDWVVEESFAAIPGLHAGVANIIPVAVRRWRNQLGHAQTWREISRFRQTLQTHAYDAVIDTQGLLKSALIAIQARGCRHGQDRQSVREPLASLFYERKHHVDRGQHAVVLPRLTLDNIAAVLARARAAVGVDTGLTHLAVALGIPTLALYTDTEPALTGVYAGAAAPAVNLGGLAHRPAPDEVILALRQLLSLPA